MHKPLTPGCRRARSRRFPSSRLPTSAPGAAWAWLAAELNGYPRPLHVLELADKLELSAEQRSSMQRLFDSMKAEAMPLGAKLIEQEAELDKQFAARTVTPESLKASTAAAAATQGILRETHLKYHLSTGSILTPSQMTKYAELRGYGGGGHKRHHHH